MSSIQHIATRASRLPLAPIAGAMLGTSVVFLCLATPLWMIERFSIDAGLPALLAAAAPPLGMKARLLIAILCGGLAFALGTGIVALFDRGGAIRLRKPTIVEEVIAPDEEEEAPGPRRRAFTARDYQEPERPRPIFAGRELGVPLDEIVEERPLAWPSADDATAAWTPEEEAEFAEPLEDDWLDLGAFPIADAAPQLEEPLETLGRDDRDRPTSDDVLAAPAGFDNTQPSVPALMARLEAGLVRRGLAGRNGSSHAAASRPGASPVIVKPPRDMDSALRDALQELHRVAAGRA